MPKSSPSGLRIAVLLTFETQVLDMAGIDLFGMLSKEYMENLPGQLSALGLDVQIYYIGKDGSEALPDASKEQPDVKADPPNPATIPVEVTNSTTASTPVLRQVQAEQTNNNLRGLTAQAYIKAEYSVTSPSVQPGQLDIVMIPGPEPGQQQSKQTLDFVRQHAKYGTTILVVCTGCYVAAQAGILDGRKASAPRALLPQLRKEFSLVKWDDQRRFVKDSSTVSGQSEGELWTSGGICNGLEMIAAFIKEKIPGPMSEAICAMADVGDKGEYYNSSVGVDNAWWLGQILRALFLGKRSPQLKRRED
ncbi:hypothetical protein LTR37_005834 [Vermiconidia calcicola]|uniref:Uncharacterized protein n=1 Tax=Vermiconidia calcicola TaxID=1690605 RepID=A0ACC3NIE1_9PEZI|nr:hypothetical protein LTR37_005834 [Vermiconidia calcicola]